MNRNDKIYVAGHDGMVGSVIMRQLHKNEYNNIITKSIHELDLRNRQAVNTFCAYEKPDYVFLAAVKVGGILANRDNKAEFFYDNTLIAQNVIHASCVNKNQLSKTNNGSVNKYQSGIDNVIPRNQRTEKMNEISDRYKQNKITNPLFNTTWYLETYPEVKEAGHNPLYHYIMWGAQLGYDTHINFSTNAYLNANPDVKKTGMNSLTHYLKMGAIEGRSLR